MTNTLEIRKYAQSLKLDDFQRQVLIGLLLGDGYLESLTQGRTYKFGFEQTKSTKNHEEYLLHVYEVFKSFCISEPKTIKKVKKGRLTFGLRFRTLTTPVFDFYAALFYKGKIKQVPKNIHEFLTPVSLAYWYMDDGALKDQDRLGKRLHTEGFSYEDVKLLCEALNQMGIKTTVQKQNRTLESGEKRTYYILYITAEGDKVFTRLIEPYVIPAMQYKLKPTQLHKK